MSRPRNYTTNFLNFLEGHLDEVRVADLARSPDWIRAEFLSVASNRTFLSYGAVIVQPAADGDGLPDGWELQYGGTNRFGAGESASGRLYRVYGSTNLIATPVEWDLLPGTDGLIGTGWPMSYTSFPQRAAGFYRIDVRQQE